jgi:hypothetical protein
MSGQAPRACEPVLDSRFHRHAGHPVLPEYLGQVLHAVMLVPYGIRSDDTFWVCNDIDQGGFVNIDAANWFIDP